MEDGWEMRDGRWKVEREVGGCNSQLLTRIRTSASDWTDDFGTPHMGLFSDIASLSQTNYFLHSGFPDCAASHSNS